MNEFPNKPRRLMPLAPLSDVKLPGVESEAQNQSPDRPEGVKRSRDQKKRRAAASSGSTNSPSQHADHVMQPEVTADSNPDASSPMPVEAEGAAAPRGEASAGDWPLASSSSNVVPTAEQDCRDNGGLAPHCAASPTQHASPAPCESVHCVAAACAGDDLKIRPDVSEVDSRLDASGEIEFLSSSGHLDEANVDQNVLHKAPPPEEGCQPECVGLAIAEPVDIERWRPEDQRIPHSDPDTVMPESIDLTGAPRETCSEAAVQQEPRELLRERPVAQTPPDFGGAAAAASIEVSAAPLPPKNLATEVADANHCPALPMASLDLAANKLGVDCDLNLHAPSCDSGAVVADCDPSPISLPVDELSANAAVVLSDPARALPHDDISAENPPAHCESGTLCVTSSRDFPEKDTCNVPDSAEISPPDACSLARAESDTQAAAAVEVVHDPADVMPLEECLDEVPAADCEPASSTPPLKDTTAANGPGDFSAMAGASLCDRPQPTSPEDLAASVAAKDLDCASAVHGISESAKPVAGAAACDLDCASVADEALESAKHEALLSARGNAKQESESEMQLPGACQREDSTSSLSSGEEQSETCRAEEKPPALAADADKLQWHHWPGDLPELKPLEEQRLRVFCGVWNLHGKSATSDLSAWLITQPMHHIYAIGTCECERSIEKSMVWQRKSRWEMQVRNHFGEDYRMVRSHCMAAIHMMVFVHRNLWRYVSEVKSAQVATGICNLLGNKGGVKIGFNVGNTSLLIVNAHLAAHVHNMQSRTQGLTRILANSPIRRQKAGTGVLDEYDRVFFMGDLNPRLDAKRSDVDDWLASNDLDQCLQRDQLLPLLRAVPGSQIVESAGLWPLFDEAEIKFPPTYKFDTQSDQYDSSKKKRVPSWTDRILWKRDPQVRSLTYGSIQSIRCSDHRPVFAQFEVGIDLTGWHQPGGVSAVGGTTKSSLCTVQ